MIYDDFGGTNDIIETTDIPIPVMRFPAPASATYEIDYVINKLPGDIGGRAVRTGVLHITVNKGIGLEGGNNPPVYHIHDDFGYTGDESVESIVFSVELKGFIPETTEIDTMVINYINPPSNGSGTINYTYRMLTK
jgi:hypothetical protein